MTHGLTYALRHDGHADEVEILIPGGAEVELGVKDRIPDGKTLRLFTRLCSPSEEETPIGDLKIETK